MDRTMIHGAWRRCLEFPASTIWVPYNRQFEPLIRSVLSGGASTMEHTPYGLVRVVGQRLNKQTQ